VRFGTARRQSINIDSDVATSQIYNPTQPTEEQQSTEEQLPATEEPTMQQLLVDDLSGSDDSDSDPEYMPHSEDSGENSEVVELRRHARKFKKRMRQTKSCIGRDANVAIPIDLVGNMEEQFEEDDKDWNFESSDEGYSYDEDSDGNSVRRKSKYSRYQSNTEIPHFTLEMMFRSKN
jgi:hypothetical protein